jgi:hypothetical protein
MVAGSGVVVAVGCCDSRAIFSSRRRTELLRSSGLLTSVRGARMPRVGVDGDLFYRLCESLVLAVVFLGVLSFGQVEAGDLEAVEEEAGAAGVDVVGGDALENLAD